MGRILKVPTSKAPTSEQQQGSRASSWPRRAATNQLRSWLASNRDRHRGGDPAGAAKPASSCAVMPAISGSRTRSIIGRAWQPKHDALSRRRYAALRQRGHSHGRALRTVADRLLSVTCTLLEQQTLFDPAYEG